MLVDAAPKLAGDAENVPRETFEQVKTLGRCEREQRPVRPGNQSFGPDGTPTLPIVLFGKADPGAQKRLPSLGLHTARH